MAVGLVYDAKARFRSRALVRVGEPVAVAQWADDYRRDERATVRAVPRIWPSSSPVPIHPSPRGRKPHSSPGSPRWSSVRRVGTRSVDVGLADKVESRRDWRPDRTSALRRCRHCSRPLRPTSGTSNCSGSTTPSWWRVRTADRRRRRSVAWSALKVLVALPFAALGALVHLIPFQIMKQVGKRPTNEGIRATVKLLGCFVLFVSTYAVLGVLVGRAYGAWAGSRRRRRAMCGSVAVRFGDRVKRIGGVAEGYRMSGPPEPARAGAGAPCRRRRRGAIDFAADVRSPPSG